MHLCPECHIWPRLTHLALADGPCISLDPETSRQIQVSVAKESGEPGLDPAARGPLRAPGW